MAIYSSNFVGYENVTDISNSFGSYPGSILYRSIAFPTYSCKIERNQTIKVKIRLYKLL